MRLSHDSAYVTAITVAIVLQLKQEHDADMRGAGLHVFYADVFLHALSAGVRVRMRVCSYAYVLGLGKWCKGRKDREGLT